jgi:hypothetical protein
MRTYSLYYSGPREREKEFPYEPTVEEMYTDFIQTIYSSDYSLKKSTLKYKDDGFVVIEVIGEK